MGQSVFDEFQQAVIDSVAEEKHKKQPGLSAGNTEDKDSGSDDNEPASGIQSKEADKEPESDYQGNSSLMRP